MNIELLEDGNLLLTITEEEQAMDYFDLHCHILEEIHSKDLYDIDGGDGWSRITRGGPEVWLLDGYGWDVLSHLKDAGTATAELSSMSLDEYEVDEYGELIK